MRQYRGEYLRPFNYEPLANITVGEKKALRDYVENTRTQQSVQLKVLTWNFRCVKDASIVLDEARNSNDAITEEDYIQDGLWKGMHVLPTPLLSLLDVVTPEYLASRAEYKV